MKDVATKLAAKTPAVTVAVVDTSVSEKMADQY